MDVQNCELGGAIATSGCKRVGPPGFGRQSDDLDVSYFGTKSEVMDFVRRFEDLNPSEL